MQAAVVVTGASGFVGRALVRHLHGLGRPVVALARHAWEAPASVRSVRIENYEDAAVLDAACTGASGVVHLAALAHRSGSPSEFAASVRAAEAVAAAAVRTRVPRLVFVSSIGVNGNLTHSEPFSEATLPQPVEPYAASKLLAEKAVAAATSGSGTAPVIVRPPLIYGPHAPGNFGRLVWIVQRGLVLPLANVRNARTLVGLDPLLDLLVLCLDHPAAAGELFLAGDTQDLSTPQLVQCIADGLGRPARLAPIPPGLLLGAATLLGQRRLVDGLCGSLRIDARKARTLLGWNPAPAVEEGVRRAARRFLTS